METTTECLVKKSDFGRIVGQNRPINGEIRIQALPAGIASTTNRYARTVTGTVAADTLQKCDCGCAGTFSVPQKIA
jgi:hypothetical protein